MTQNLPFRQIRWRCHRGMLELDLILLKFMDNGFSELPDSDRHLFVELLEEQDPILYHWFLHPLDTKEKFKKLVGTILEASKSRVEHTDKF